MRGLYGAFYCDAGKMYSFLRRCLRSRAPLAAVSLHVDGSSNDVFEARGCVHCRAHRNCLDLQRFCIGLLRMARHWPGLGELRRSDYGTVWIKIKVLSLGTTLYCRSRRKTR
jgi:hypothetical protein